MIGHHPLLRMRLAGQAPAGFVSIDLDRQTRHARDWPSCLTAFPQVEIAPSEAIRTLDLRFVVGLYVVAFADAWSERFGELIDLLQANRPKHLIAHAFDLDEPIVWPEPTWPQ